MDNFFAAKRYFPLFMRDVGLLGAVDNSVDNFETILWITLWKTFAGDHPHVLFFLFSDFEALDDTIHHQPIEEVLPGRALRVGQVIFSDRGVAPLGGVALVGFPPFRITKLILGNYHGVQYSPWNWSGQISMRSSCR